MDAVRKDYIGRQHMAIIHCHGEMEIFGAHKSALIKGNLSERRDVRF